MSFLVNKTVVHMVTVTRCEIIELNVRIEIRMVKISFFAVLLIHDKPHLITVVGNLIRILKRLERLQANIETSSFLYAYKVKFHFAYWH